MAESLGLKQVGGAIVSAVAPDSAADRAGMKRGDVIKSFNGQPVHDFNSAAQPRGRHGARLERHRRDRPRRHREDVTVKLDEARKSSERDAARNAETGGARTWAPLAASASRRRLRRAWRDRSR